MLKGFLKTCKLIAVPITIMILISGCGGNNSTVDNTNVEGVAVTKAGELPIVNKEITLTVGYPQSTTIIDFDTNEYTLWLKEQTNINLKFEMFPGTNPTERVQMMLASNSKLPDVLMRVGMTESMLLEYGGEQEVFLPLNDYIEEYGHWTQRMFETAIIDNLEKRMKTADGKIYYIPYYVEQTGNLWSNKAWINRVWLDNLGLDMPKTTEDFKRVLQAIKSGDPNGNGKEDEIPYTGSINGMKEETFPFLMNSFIYCDYENYFLDNAGKVEAAYIKPEWKEGLKYMRELAAEGLFDTQSLSQDTQTLRTLLRNTDAAIVGSFAGNSIDLQMGVDSPRLADYQGLAPLEGPKGVAYSTRGPGNPSINYGGVITKYCSNPEAAFRLMDFMLSEEASMRARYGVPGVDWEEPQEGDICMFENIGAEPYVRPILAYGSVQNSHWQSTHPVFRHRAMSDGMVWDGDPLNGEYIKAQALSLYINKAPEKTIDKMTFTIEEMNEFESLKQLIRGYVRENVAMFITGEKDIEKDWDNYLDELNRMGLNKMLDLAQTGYDRFNQS